MQGFFIKCVSQLPRAPCEKWFYDDDGQGGQNVDEMDTLRNCNVIPVTFEMVDLKADRKVVLNNCLLFDFSRYSKNHCIYHFIF